MEKTLTQIDVDPRCDPDFLKRGEEIFKILHDAGETFILIRQIGQNSNLMAEGGTETFTELLAAQGFRQELFGVVFVVGMIRLLRLKPELLDVALAYLKGIDEVNLQMEGPAANS